MHTHLFDFVDPIKKNNRRRSRHDGSNLEAKSIANDIASAFKPSRISEAISSQKVLENRRNSRSELNITWDQISLKHLTNNPKGETEQNNSTKGLNANWQRDQITAVRQKGSGNKPIEVSTVSQWLREIEDFSSTLTGNNNEASEEDAVSLDVQNLELKPKYIHAGSCSCFACAFNRDSFTNKKESNTDLEADSNVTTNPSIAFGTLNELSDYLTTGYWQESGTYTRKFNLGSSGTGAKNGQLTYNITGWNDDSNGLTASRRELAREVFKLYKETTGIDFVEVTTGGDIRFTDNDSGAYAYLGGGWWDQYPNSAITDYSVINIASNWYGGDSSYVGYTTQTILHEVGHSLGLGHQGLYNAGNGSPTYENSAQYGNDGWSVTMMSYWDQTENTNMEGSFAFLQTPMTADLLALDKLYESQGFGSANAFNGDTIYGIGTNISRNTSEIMHNFSQAISETSYTIVDGGGYDILDISNFSEDQYINLAPSNPNDELPSSSSIGGLINNLMIGANTIIEQAIGGSGNDTFIGNRADNVFEGGGGGDNFYDSTGSDIYFGGLGNNDTVHFEGLYSQFNITDLGSSLSIANEIVNTTDIDEVWSDVEFFYFDNSIVKTYEELLADISTANLSPTANEIILSITEDETADNISFDGADPDDGDILSYAITNLPSKGSVLNNGDGTFSYDPGTNFEYLNQNETESVVFTYIARDDNNAESAENNIIVTINGVNDAPVASSQSFSTEEDLIYNGQLLAATDIDSDQLTYSLVSSNETQKGSLTLYENGSFSYDPGTDFLGLNDNESEEVVFNYVAIDESNANSNQANLAITVNGKTEPFTIGTTEENLFFDDFENPTATASQWDIDNVWKSRDRFVGSSLNGESIGITMEVDGSATTSQVLSLAAPIITTGFDIIEISFDWRIEDVWDKSDFMRFEINQNNSGWTTLNGVSDLQGLRRRNSAENQWVQENIQLDSSSLESLQIQFSANVNKAGEDGYINNVSIVGINETPASTVNIEADSITGSGSSATPPGSSVSSSMTPINDEIINPERLDKNSPDLDSSNDLLTASDITSLNKTTVFSENNQSDEINNTGAQSGIASISPSTQSESFTSAGSLTESSTVTHSSASTPTDII